MVIPTLGVLCRVLLIPKKGWVQLIRSALGLSSYQLAKRMQVNQSRIMQIEAGERNLSVTLKTLKRVAEAMDCQFVYGIIPGDLLLKILEQQAKKVAKERISRVSHSMGLEAQNIDYEKQQKQVEELTQELLNGSLSKLWSDE